MKVIVVNVNPIAKWTYALASGKGSVAYTLEEDTSTQRRREKRIVSKV
jgi:hypothetical protein